MKRIKKSNLNTELDISLKQNVETRWASIYDMLASIEYNYSKLTILLKQLQCEHLLSFTLDLLGRLCDFLQGIKEFILML